MPRESTIRIFRSDTAAAVPSLTAGEIAVNIPDQRLFVGNSTGGVIPFFGNGVTGVNGITGGVSITSGSNITITQSGKTITVGTSLPLASSTVTGVASFNNEFVVSNLGNVGLTSNYVRSWNGLTGAVLFSNFVSSINNITGAFGLTGTQHEIEIIGATSMVVGLPDNVRITQTLTISGGTAWHSLNDGKNSGLDADLVHGVYGTRFTENLQTGLLYGGVLSINTGNTAAFNISAGSGIIVDSNATTGAAPNPTVTTVNWNAATGLTLPGLTSQDITWISVNSSGNVIRYNSTFTNSQYENEIVIGALIHPSRTFISFAKNYPHVAYGQASQFDPFIRAFGPLKLSGHELSGSATTLQLNRSSGTSYAIGRNYLTDPDNPNIITDTNATPVSTIYRLRRNTTNGFTTVINSAVDPGNYDDGTGTLAAVPGGQYTIQRVFFYPSEPTVLAVYYGRATYNSIDNAKAAIPYEQFSESTDTAESAIFCGYLIVKSGATNFSNAADYQFIQAGLFRSTSNVGSGGVAVVRLDDLTDVTITSPTDNNYLGYNSTLSQWVNIPFTSLPIVTSFNGATGTVTFAPPLATSSVTGVASFPNTDFSVSSVGAVSLTGNVARTHIGQTFTGLQVFSSGLSANGLTGTILTPAQTNITSLGTLTSLNTAGITSTQRVTISSGGLSVVGNIDGTIGTAAQPNITSLGTLTSLNSAGLTSTQRVNISAGGIVVQAGGLSVTGGANLTGGSTFFGDIEVFDGAFIRTGGLSVTGGIAGTLVTPAQTNITSVGVLSGLSVNNGLSVTGSATITGGLNAYGNTTTWGSLLAKTTVSIESGGLRSQLGATFGDPNYGFGDDPVINLYRANNELLRIGAARGGSFLGGLNNLYVFDILGPNAGQTRAVNFRRGTNFDGASASNHVTIMSFDTSDNVGIRTASPGATFDVAGTLRASGIGTFTGGLTANNLFVSQGTTFGSGINVISGGISVTGGIAGTLLTSTQPNVTQVGSLVSLTSAGATFSQRVNITNGGLSAGGGIIVQSGGIGVTGGMHVTGGANIYGLVGINLSGSSPIDNLTVFGNYGLFAASLAGGGTSQYFNIRSYHANAAVAYDQYDVYNWGATITKWIGRWYGGSGVQTAYIMGVVDDSTGYPNQNTHTTFNTSPSATPRDAAVIYIGSGNSGGNQRTSLYAEQGAVLAASGGTVGIGTNSPGAKLDVNGTFRSLGRASFPVGLTSANLFVDAGATFGANIYAPNMVTGVNGITGAVSITSGSNITITQSGKQITIASSASGGGGITWSVITTDQSLTVNTGVLANKSSGTLTLTLPTTAAVGTTIRVSGMQNTWRVAQNASQKINFGSISTTTGTGGYLESTNARDSVELVCCVANTEWNVVSSIGNMTIV